jgi:hypothetical protein
VTATTLVTVIHGVVALAIVGAATALLALHDVDSTTALALYGASLALVGGTTNTLLALRVPAPSSSGGPAAADG